jgi:predicted signal transduction protein with EAL and GGDEF domain
MLDIDHFKRVNDRHGHEAGDRLLTGAVERWQSQLRPGDSISRFGGDEFVVVLPRTTPSQGRQVVDRLRAGLPDDVTCSAGVAAWRPGDSMSMLLSRVDAALYEAKRSGRDRTVANSDDEREVRALAAAIQHGQLLLHYQPVASLRTGRVASFEALVRWQHPDRGLLQPSEFIPLAEESRLVVPLGEFVLERACRDAHGWLDRCGDQPTKVAVNVSGRQLDDPGFTDAVARVLGDSGLPARLLTIEVTETVLADSLPSWVDRLWDLRRLGVELAMDDFGTGYSSLNQLRRLPFGVIKIDRSFVEDLPDSQEAVALVAAMVGIGRALKRSIVAEGVETAEQLEQVREAGCDEAQGFLLGRPVTADVAARLLGRQLLAVTARAPGDQARARAG